MWTSLVRRGDSVIVLAPASTVVVPSAAVADTTSSSNEEPTAVIVASTGAATSCVKIAPLRSGSQFASSVVCVVISLTNICGSLNVLKDDITLPTPVCTDFQNESQLLA